MHKVIFLLLTIGLLIPTSAFAQSDSSFLKAQLDLNAAKRNIAGPRTEILTLGSTHLSGHENFRREMLSLLLDRLERFHPTIITHESLSGQQCEIVKNYPASYGDVFDAYCWDHDAAFKATGLTIDKAEEAINKTLSNWPDTPAPQDRRRLAVLFLAANDRPSAQVQWLRLPVAERIKSDGVDDALFTILDRRGSKMNESYDIAVALAVRLRHERVYAVDDHTSDASLLSMSEEEYGKALAHIWDTPALNEWKKIDEQRVKTITTPEAMLGYYKEINRPEVIQKVANFDFLAAVQYRGTPNYGRYYVAWWETRNLRMVANIRSISALHPGARILNIVGASHKGYYDNYLNMMHDVTVVDVKHYLY